MYKFIHNQPKTLLFFHIAREYFTLFRLLFINLMENYPDMKTKRFTFLPGFLFSGIIIFLAFSSTAQEVIEVTMATAKMSEGHQPSYYVEIPGAVLKTTQQNWVKKLQENIKVKATEANHEWVLANVVKSELTKDTISVYTVFIEKDNRVRMNVFVKTDSVFFSPVDDKSDLASDKIDNNIKNYIRNFAVSQYKLATGLQLETEQKLLKSLEGELNKLVKENDNLKKEISSLENDIEKTERSISGMDQQIDLKQQESMTHKTFMQGILTDEDKKAALEKDKNLAKEKDKLEKDRSKAKKDISNMESKIEKNKKAIKDNETLQEEKQAEIDAQKLVVTQVQAVVNAIK